MKKLSAKVAACYWRPVWVVSGASSAARGSAGIVPGKLTCEYQIDPSVVDAQHPRLSWINTAAAGLRGQEQRAYQIEVASTEKALRDGTADLWNSGKVKSPQSTLVKYAGKPLQSRETCWWRVRVWDGKGNVSAWSEPAAGIWVSSIRRSGNAAGSARRGRARSRWRPWARMCRPGPVAAQVVRRG